MEGGFPKPKLINLIKKMGNKKNIIMFMDQLNVPVFIKSFDYQSRFKKRWRKYVTLGNIAENFDYIIESKKKSFKNKKVGELILFGPNVGLGYVGDEKVTRENFILDGKKFNSRGYKTGDLVYFNKKRNKIFYWKKRYSNQTSWP